MAWAGEGILDGIGSPARMMKSKARILVVKLSSLGDVIHALPAVHAIRCHLNARIDWVTQPEYEDLVRCFTDVDRVLLFHRKAAFRRMGALLRDVRAETYDLAIDFQGLMKSAIIVAAARAGRTLGPSYHREGSGLFYNDTAGSADRSRHAVLQAFDCAKFLGVPDSEIQFPISFPAAEINTARPRIMLIPCSRWPTKNWPADRFAELGQRLVNDLGATLYVAGGPADRDVCASIESSSAGIHNLCGKTTLPMLGGFLQEMDLVVTVDTGPMHMAAAVGTPVVAIFGPTNPERTSPFGTQHRIVHADIDLGDKSWRSFDDDVIRSITVDRVADEIFRFVNHLNS
jgi:lipopolysaccharide heptosyltransferase I